MKLARKITGNAMYTAIDLIEEGVTCYEVALVSKLNIVKESRVGYPIGIGYPPDWGEQTISIRPGDRNILQENMTLHILPALFQADSGFVVSESIRVTKNGCECLTDVSQDLVVK